MNEELSMPDVYLSGCRRVADLAGALTGSQPALRVPACPEWNVRQLLAHLAGAGADTLAGRMDGAVGPAWSTRHVGERRERAVNELVDELLANAPAVAESCTGVASPSPAWDIVVHEADLRELLGGAPARQHTWVAVLRAAMALVSGQVKDLRIESDGLPPAGDAGAPIVLRAPPYELFRGLFSRRSGAQLARWPWAGDPESVLDRFPLFGPREDEQPVPARYQWLYRR